MPRHALTDEQWARLQPLLPPEKPIGQGRPSKIKHRKVLDAILWLVRTGAAWRDLPDEYAPWESIASRFYRWRDDGTWSRVFKALLNDADTRGLIDWDMHCVDSSVIRAHQHAAGGKKGQSVRLAGAGAGSVRKYIFEQIAKATRSRSGSRAEKYTT